MTSHTPRRCFMLALLLLGVVAAGPALAGDGKDEITARAKERFPKIASLKDAGRVGETSRGFLEAVKPADAKSEEVGPLVDAENADRRKLYAILARELSQKEGREVSPDAVGELNARRIFRDAKPTDYFKSNGGEWFQKKDRK